MSKRKILLPIITVFLISACSSMYYKDPYLNIHQGMTKAQVIQILGNPTDRSFEEVYETWYYKDDLKVITFESGVVKSLRVDQEEIDRRHEIEKAKAGSTKINIGTTTEGRTVRHRHPLPCTGSNFYGKFASGGGCNIYGCWPPGGSCNTFGCSMAGKCTATGGCPQEIENYECRGGSSDWD